MIWGVGHSSSSVRFCEGQASVSYPGTEGTKSQRRMSECGWMHGRSERNAEGVFLFFDDVMDHPGRDVAVCTDNDEPFLSVQSLNTNINTVNVCNGRRRIGVARKY